MGSFNRYQTMDNPVRNFKQEAHRLVDRLPDNATWYDLMFIASERYDGERYDLQATIPGAHTAADTPAECDQSSTTLDL
jgi:hypothetical protein